MKSVGKVRGRRRLGDGREVAAPGWGGRALHTHPPPWSDRLELPDECVTTFAGAWIVSVVVRGYATSSIACEHAISHRCKTTNLIVLDFLRPCGRRLSDRLRAAGPMDCKLTCCMSRLQSTGAIAAGNVYPAAMMSM